MAIDSSAKRRSAGGVPFLPVGPGVTPDAAKPVAWRQQSGWGYSGIETSEAQVGAFARGTATIVPRASGVAGTTARAAGTASSAARASGTATVGDGGA